MEKWNILMLVIGFTAFHFIDGQDAQTLKVCDGRTANFTANFDPQGHDGIDYSFRNKGGIRTTIYDIKSSNKQPIIDEAYKVRFNIPTVSSVGFTLNNVNRSDEGDFACNIMFPDGTGNRFIWTLEVEDSTKLTKPKVELVKNESGNKTYSCTPNEKMQVETYWEYAAGIRIYGSYLNVSETKDFQIIKCVIKSYCHASFRDYNISQENGCNCPVGTTTGNVTLLIAILLPTIVVTLVVALALVLLKKGRRFEITRRNSDFGIVDRMQP